MTVDLRCPELAALYDIELIEGQIGYAQGDLYGIWIDEERCPGQDFPHWWYRDYVAWFTPDVRIAHAQRDTAMAFHWAKPPMRVCRLGPNGEPIELEQAVK